MTLNPAVDITVPDNVKAFQPPPVNVTSEKLADGVFYLKGATHHSFAIEMADHIVARGHTEQSGACRGGAGQGQRTDSEQADQLRRHLAPPLGSPRRHPRRDRRGRTIVTHESNKAFLERVATTPHTIKPDREAESKKPVKVQTVGDDGQLTDGKRVIELHRLQGYEHTGDMLVVYLPKERILGEPDAFTPPAQAGTPLIAPAVPSAKALSDNIKRLKLNVKTIAPFHGNRMTNVAELDKAATPGARATN